MVVITPTESHVVPYAAYFSSNNTPFYFELMGEKTEQRRTASCIFKYCSQLLRIFTLTLAELES